MKLKGIFLKEESALLAELKKNLSFTIPNYNKLVEGKCASKISPVGLFFIGVIARQLPQFKLI